MVNNSVTSLVYEFWERETRKVSPQNTTLWSFKILQMTWLMMGFLWVRFHFLYTANKRWLLRILWEFLWLGSLTVYPVSSEHTPEFTLVFFSISSHTHWFHHGLQLQPLSCCYLCKGCCKKKMWVSALAEKVICEGNPHTQLALK